MNSGVGRMCSLTLFLFCLFPCIELAFPKTKDGKMAFREDEVMSSWMPWRPFELAPRCENMFWGGRGDEGEGGGCHVMAQG